LKEERNPMSKWLRWKSTAIFALIALIAGCGSDRTTEPSGDLDHTTISAGGWHSCGLTADGTAYCWGRDFDRAPDGSGGTARLLPVRVATDLKFTHISAGDVHTCAIADGGKAYCWGDNIYGQLGLGTTARQATPVAVAGGHLYKEVKTADQVTCGITLGDDAYCWGTNRWGHLGTTTTETCGGGFQRPCSTLPRRVSTTTKFTSIELGHLGACGLTGTGAAFCWGINQDGQLGNGTLDFTEAPLAVSGGHAFADLAPGLYHTCGLTTVGDAYCWGANAEGQLGSTTATDCGLWDCSPVPIRVATSLKFVSIEAGEYFNCALTAAGTAHCWGRGSNGELGDGRQTRNSYSPVTVSSGAVKFTQLSAGFYHGCAIATSGAGYCWGHNGYGALGIGTTELSTTPVATAAYPP
jgi:alpha-tubulin suppressor-like RCC1 family protein